MAEESWESVTKIGSKVRGGASEPKEKVLRGESAINAARRTGSAVTTEKKFATANQVGFPPPFPPSILGSFRPARKSQANEAQG
jgi:hypothetical protein